MKQKIYHLIKKKPQIRKKIDNDNHKETGLMINCMHAEW